MLAEAREVVDVQSHDHGDAVDQHRRDHVRVMDLFPARPDVRKQAKQTLGDLGVLRKQGGPLAMARTLPSASDSFRPRPFLSAGRVATARYSRKICPLVHRIVAPAAQSLRIVSASWCSVLLSSVAASNTFVSTITRSGGKTRLATLVAIDLLPGPG